MATFTNESGHDLDIPALGLYVEAGDSFDVSEADAAGLRDQSVFVETNPPKRAATTKAAAPAEPAEPDKTTTTADAPAGTEQGE